MDGQVLLDPGAPGLDPQPDVRLGGPGERVEHFAEVLEACKPLCRALQALRGIDPVVAATVVAEVGDMRRFPSAWKFMGDLGLVPSERFSDPRTSRGSITKAGNPHVRWKLIESARHARHRPAHSIALERRSKDAPVEVRAIAWKAQKMLHKRYWAMAGRGKRGQTVVVAMARELAGFIWAIGQVVPRPARQSRLRDPSIFRNEASSTVGDPVTRRGETLDLVR